MLIAQRFRATFRQSPGTACHPDSATSPIHRVMITPLQPRRVLVVDDAPLIREIIARTLRTAGHTIDTATDGQEALAKFREGKWDLVITDLFMPHMNGEELAAAIRAEAPGVPVVLLTGTPTAVRDPSAFLALLPKPFRGNEILEIIAAIPCETSA